MSYELHITREDMIELDEWELLVSTTDGVRCSQAGSNAIGSDCEVISIKHRPGDTEVFFPDESCWCMVFRLSSNGKITFKAPVDWNDRESIVRRLATCLAQNLNARIVGDEGEVYFE